MLRITQILKNGSLVILKLEGKILADWVSLLERECRTLIGERKRVRLDLSGVSYMDVNGVEMVRALPSRQVTIINAPDFIVDLLRQGGKP